MSTNISYLSLAASIIILQYLAYSCSTGLAGSFAESPSSVTIEVENGVERDAVFRCCHQRRDALISWLINGSSSRLYPDVVDGFMRDSNGTRVDTLTIPAIPEYNGTEVVCVANFLDGSPIEVTLPTGLIIIVVSEVITQLSPTTIVEPEIAGFVMTPFSLNKTVEQGVAVFHCQHNSCDGITWRVNGISTASPNVITQVIRLSDRHFRSSLSIATLPDFNNTTIECGAVFFDGSLLQFTPPVTLLLQDIPGNISNLGFKRNYSSGILTTSWDPLPTIDITGRDPNIIYHMEIFKITCGQSVLISDENVTEIITNNNLNEMEIYKAIVTPRNNVPGYINGPSVAMQERFMHLNGSTLFHLIRRYPIDFRNDEPVPSYYTIILDPLDGIGDNQNINISVQRDGEIISMHIEEALPSKRLWNASILPYDCEGDRQVTELSTHDVQHVVINSSLPDQIRVTGEFVDESSATGVLLIIYDITNESDTHYHVITKQPEQNSISMNVAGLTGTEYGVSVFALENGLPFPCVVTSPKNVIMAVTSAQERTLPPLPPIESEVHSSGSRSAVCVKCTFSDDTLKSCVAVVHQRISQLSSSTGLMNIESSHRFTRSGDTAYGCIEGVNLEQYQVGVVGARVRGNETQITKLSDSKRSAIICGVICITSSATALVSIVLLLVVCIALVISCRIKQYKSVEGSSTETEAGVELHKCSAYEIVKLSRQRVEMETNPAYGEVGQFHH